MGNCVKETISNVTVAIKCVKSRNLLYRQKDQRPGIPGCLIGQKGGFETLSPQGVSTE